MTFGGRQWQDLFLPFLQVRDRCGGSLVPRGTEQLQEVLDDPEDLVQAVDFLQHLLEPCASNRFTALQALRHPFMRLADGMTSQPFISPLLKTVSAPVPATLPAPVPPPVPAQTLPFTAWECSLCTYLHCGEEAGYIACVECGSLR